MENDNGVFGMGEMETPLTMHERGVSGKPTAFDKLMQSPQWKAAKAEKDPETGHIFSDKERKDGAEYIVENLWSKAHTDELVKRLDSKNPVFITMPSTSRQNILPDALAERLQKELGGTVLLGSDIASPMYAKEMKTVPSDDRPFVPREFVLYDPEKLQKDAAGKGVVVVEDVFSSGASAKAFCDTLKESKVQVQTVAGLLGDSRLAAEPQLVTKLQKTLKQGGFDAFKAKDISAVLSRGQINTLIDEINKTQSKEGQEKSNGQKRITEGLQRVFDSRTSRAVGQNIWRSEGGIKSSSRNDDRNIDVGTGLRSNAGSQVRGEDETGNLRESRSSQLNAHQDREKNDHERTSGKVQGILDIRADRIVAQREQEAGGENERDFGRSRDGGGDVRPTAGLQSQSVSQIGQGNNEPSQQPRDGGSISQPDKGEQDKGKNGHEHTADSVQGVSDGRTAEPHRPGDRRSEGHNERLPRNAGRTESPDAGVPNIAGRRGEIDAEQLRSNQIKAHQELRAQDTMIQSTGGAQAYEKLAKDKAVSIERQVDRLHAKAETLLTKARKEEQQLRANPPSRVKALLNPKLKTNWQKRIEQAKRRADRAEKTTNGCDTLKRDAVRMKVKIDSAVARSATPDMLAAKRREDAEREKALAEKRRQEEEKRREQTKDMMKRLEAERSRSGNTLGLGRDRQMPRP
jgi:orotate phosphoribosyltransferase